MAVRTRLPREEAARALCHMDGHPPDIDFEGAPKWQSYLPQVDTVLMIVMGEQAVAQMIAADREASVRSAASEAITKPDIITRP